MALEVKRRLSSGVAILDLTGQATAGEGANLLRSEIVDAFLHSSRHILLNCEKLDYADSSAMGEMLAAYSSVVRDGGSVKLLRPHRRVRLVLEITRLSRIFDIFDDEHEALASFNSASAAKGQQAITDFLADN